MSDKERNLSVEMADSSLSMVNHDEGNPSSDSNDGSPKDSFQPTSKLGTYAQGQPNTTHDANCDESEKPWYENVEYEMCCFQNYQDLKLDYITDIRHKGVIKNTKAIRIKVRVGLFLPPYVRFIVENLRDQINALYTKILEDITHLYYYNEYYIPLPAKYWVVIKPNPIYEGDYCSSQRRHLILTPDYNMLYKALSYFSRIGYENRDGFKIDFYFCDEKVSNNRKYDFISELLFIYTNK
jgi:hypothetical protein